jgi:hypothetical protein
MSRRIWSALLSRAAHYARRVVEMTPKVSSPATDDMQREIRELIENGGAGL